MAEFPKWGMSFSQALPGRPYFSLLFLGKWSLVRHICQTFLRATPQPSCVLTETVKVTKTLKVLPWPPWLSSF